MLDPRDQCAAGGYYGRIADETAPDGTTRHVAIVTMTVRASNNNIIGTITMQRIVGQPDEDATLHIGFGPAFLDDPRD